MFMQFQAVQRMGKGRNVAVSWQQIENGPMWGFMIWSTNTFQLQACCFSSTSTRFNFVFTRCSFMVGPSSFVWLAADNLVVKHTPLPRYTPLTSPFCQVCASASKMNGEVQWSFGMNYLQKRCALHNLGQPVGTSTLSLYYRKNSLLCIYLVRSCRAQRLQDPQTYTSPSSIMILSDLPIRYLRRIFIHSWHLLPNFDTAFSDLGQHNLCTRSSSWELHAEFTWLNWAARYSQSGTTVLCSSCQACGLMLAHSHSDEYRSRYGFGHWRYHQAIKIIEVSHDQEPFSNTPSCSLHSLTIVFLSETIINLLHFR